ncbi:hypothetical protein [Thiomicrospira pelophila]|uniref:hypothetical protein n=1 Tax=Thiomicrospira pelophila TaxID=934 RepID=UPI0004A730B0|nr:hypothetical protein [Thiomicrospira pelophila]
MKRIYIDNDIGLKLAHYGVLRGLVEYSLERGFELYCLQSLKYIAQRYVDSRSDILDKKAFTEQINYLIGISREPQIGLETIQVLQEIEHSDIDEGELTLIGSAIDNNGCIATGDKRAITATHSFVKTHPGVLSGLGFLTLEQVINMALELFGNDAFDTIKRYCTVDGAINLCFRSGCKNEAQTGLVSFVNSIKSDCIQFTFCNTEDGSLD